MGTLRFLIKRFVAQRMLGVAVIVTLAFCIGVLVAGPVYADAAREAIFTSTVSTAAVTTTNARLQVFGSQGFDHAAADAAVRQGVQDVPVRTIVSAGLADVHLEGAAGPAAPLIFRDGAPAHLPFQGDAPGPGEVALPEITAGVLGLRIGDRVAIAGPSGARTLLITGTYGRADPSDPFWFGERNPFPDPESPDPIPVLVDREVFLELAATLDLSATYTWDLYLGLTDLTFPQATSVPAAIERATAELRSQPGLSSLRVQSGLADLLEVARQRVENLRVPILLVVFQIGAVTLAVLAGVGALALGRQAFELSVLHSRGFSALTLLAAQAGQAAVAALLALPLGIGLAALLARLASRSNGRSLPRTSFPIHVSGGALLLGAVVATVGVAILTALSVPHVRRTVLEQRHAITREDRPPLLRLPVEAVVLPLAIFAFVQLRDGAAPDPRGGSIDPLVLLAPTLFVLAGSFLAIRLLLFAFRRLDGVVGRSRRLPVYLAGRRIARSPGTGSAVALLLLLSVGLLVVSSSYRATVLRNHADVAHQQVGSDWNVQVASPARPLAAIARMPSGTTPVARIEPSFLPETTNGTPAAFGVDPATFARGAWWRSDAASLPLDTLLTRLSTPRIGMPVNTAGRLDVALEVPPAAAGLHLQVTTLAGNGEVTTTDTGALPAGPSTAEVSMRGAASLLSITLAEIRPIPDLPFQLSLDVRSVTLDGDAVDLSTWQPVNWRGAHGTLTPRSGGVRYDIEVGSGEVVGGLEPSLPVLPAIMSPSMTAEHGSSFTVTLGGQQLEVRRVATADRFPTLPPDQQFLVVSLPALLERAQAIPEAGVGIGEVWAVGEADPAPRLQALGFAVGGSQAAAPIEAGLAELPRSLAVGMHLTAAAGGIVLVIVGVGVGLFFAQRRRQYEFAALQAMGTDPGQVRRTLVLEQVVLIGFAVGAGLAIGYAMLRLTMPYVSKSLGFSYPEPVLVLDWPLLGTALAAVLVSTLLALGAAVRSVSSSSVTGVLRGEAE